MTQHYWFKANKTGYGWHPHTWEGFLVFFVYVGLLIHSYMQVDATTNTLAVTLWAFLPRFLLFTGLLTVITYAKGESIRWGDKGKDQHQIP